jgi:hypothetical protein
MEGNSLDRKRAAPQTRKYADGFPSFFLLQKCSSRSSVAPLKRRQPSSHQHQRRKVEGEKSRYRPG